MEDERRLVNAGVGMQLPVEEMASAPSQLKDQAAEEHCSAIAADQHKGQL